MNHSSAKCLSTQVTDYLNTLFYNLQIIQDGYHEMLVVVKHDKVRP